MITLNPVAVMGCVFMVLIPPTTEKPVPPELLEELVPVAVAPPEPLLDEDELEALEDVEATPEDVLDEVALDGLAVDPVEEPVPIDAAVPDEVAALGDVVPPDVVVPVDPTDELLAVLELDECVPLDPLLLVALDTAAAEEVEVGCTQVPALH